MRKKHGTTYSESFVPAERIERVILLIRGHNVMLDRDLAELYGVPTKVLNQAVKRNLRRFPEDFMFQVSREEARDLRSQIVTLDERLSGRGRYSKYRPYAFTEQGVAMLSGVLNSQRAIDVNVEIMRAFVRLRQLLASHAELARKLKAMEKKYDARFRVVFDAIRQLMLPPAPKPRRVLGFRPTVPNRSGGRPLARLSARWLREGEASSTSSASRCTPSPSPRTRWS